TVSHIHSMRGGSAFAIWRAMKHDGHDLQTPEGRIPTHLHAPLNPWLFRRECSKEHCQRDKAQKREKGTRNVVSNTAKRIRREEAQRH
ncbi:hypothetical protein SK128_011925, partial [Halocaridina rubra]